MPGEASATSQGRLGPPFTTLGRWGGPWYLLSYSGMRRALTWISGPRRRSG